MGRAAAEYRTARAGFTDASPGPSTNHFAERVDSGTSGANCGQRHPGRQDLSRRSSFNDCLTNAESSTMRTRIGLAGVIF